MKILVTGGAGFIGSHTCDRLVSLGHDVVVLDALTPPVHRNGPPSYLNTEVEFYQGDVRNRDLLTNLLRRVDAVYHLAAYQDYLTDFAHFSDVNVVSTALLYEIVVAERLDLARVVVASSQSAMGEGLYFCPADGDQLPGMRPEAALAAAHWEIPCAECGGPLEMRTTPERIPTPRTLTGCPSSARRWSPSTWAVATASPQSPCGTASCKAPANRSTTPTRVRAASSASITFKAWRRSYTKTARPSVIMSTLTTSSTPTCSCSTMTGPSGRVFNVGGGKPVTTREFADIVMRQYRSEEPAKITGEYRFGDTRHILSDIQALRSLGVGTAPVAGGVGVGLRQLARRYGGSRRGADRSERQNASPRASSGGSAG